MGGKPWQSAGCLNCKKQKKRCDQRKPECQRCQARGVQCLGYETNRFFFHQTQTSITASDEKKKNKNKNKSESTIAHSQYLTRAQPAVFTEGPSMRQQLLSAYIAGFFPIEVKGSLAIDPWYDLFTGMVKMPNKPVMLEKALAAKACIWISKTEHGGGNSMFYHGLQLFNSAIESMSRQLSRKRDVYSDELVYTIATFQALVSCHCPQGLEVWLDQMTVTNGILKQCFTRASNSPLVKTLYLAFHRTRMLQSLSPLQSSNPIDLEADEFPYTIPDDAYGPIDELMELMADMSPYLSAIQSINSADQATCQKLVQNCLEHRHLLLSWYAREVSYIGGLPFIGTSITKLPPTDDLFGPSYRFSTLDGARLTVTYWAALSILQAIIGQATCYAHNPSPSPIDIISNDDYQLSKFYADEISRAMPYCVQDENRAWGSNISIFALSQIGKVYLEFRCHDKFMWSQEVFELMASRGSDFPRHIAELLLFGWNLQNASPSPASELSSQAPSQP